MNVPETEEKPHRHGKVVQSSRLPAHPCKEETLDVGERDALQARRDAVRGLFRMETLPRTLFGGVRLQDAVAVPGAIRFENLLEKGVRLAFPIDSELLAPVLAVERAIILGHTRPPVYVDGVKALIDPYRDLGKPVLVDDAIDGPVLAGFDVDLDLPGFGHGLCVDIAGPLVHLCGPHDSSGVRRLGEQERVPTYGMPGCGILT